jgi:hypothetical protein
VAFEDVGDIRPEYRLNIGWPQRRGFAILHGRVVIIGRTCSWTCALSEAASAVHQCLTVETGPLVAAIGPSSA